MQIQEKYNLKKLTTMQVGGPARFFVSVKSLAELKEAVKWAKQKELEIFVLSGGSNVVISDRGFDGLVININILGFKKIKEDDKYVWLEVGAGEVWDEVVAKIVDQGWWGVENLSWIPGKMGACAVQNSGAYGQELKNAVAGVKVLELSSGEIKELKAAECKFGYRQSLFNTAAKGKYIIAEVVLKLAKQGQPQIDYPDVQEYFKQRDIKEPSLREIRQAIIYIRDNKLPNMAKAGSAGSFFKNLVLDDKKFKILLLNLEKNFGQAYVKQAEELKDKFKIEDGIKIPTAWLIEICGLKGTQVGHVKVYEKQPLVLITELGKAKAAEVMGLFKKVRQVVYNKTGMKLEPEPRLMGFKQEELKKYFELS